MSVRERFGPQKWARVSRMLAALAVASVSSTALNGQVVARQGAPRFDPAKTFVSPMILEFDAPTLGDLGPGLVWHVSNVEEYRCEDVWIKPLDVKRIDKGKGEARFEIAGFIFVAESYDRFVTLRFDLLDGERQIATVTERKISAEEKKIKKFKTDLRLEAGQTQAFAAAKAPKLRMTMWLLKDGSGPYVPADRTQ